MKSYTDLEQSKKLADILPLESADGFYAANVIITEPFITYLNGERNIPGYKDAIPCWSLVALLGLIKSVNGNSYTLIGTLDGGAMISFEEVTNIMFQEEEIIDAVFEMIMKLHELKVL